MDWFQQAEALRAASCPVKAKAAYKNAILSHPDHAASWHRMGNMCKALGELAQAEQAYRRAFLIDGGNVELLRQFGNVLKERGLTDEAERVYRSALEQAPEDHLIAYSLGALFDGAWERGSARKALNRALSLCPDHMPTLQLIGWLSVGEGRIEAMLTVARRILCLNPEVPAPWRMLSALYLEAGRNRDALRAVIHALTLAPSDPEILCEFATLLARLGRDREADQAFRRGSVVLPDFPFLKIRWSQAKLSRNQMADALALLFDALGVPEECRSQAKLGQEQGRGITAPVAVAVETEGRITVATSLMPKRIQAQQAAVSSWMASGFDVVSINSPAEILELSVSFPAVRFAPALTTAEATCGRPLVPLNEILRVLRETPSSVCGIINSDIIITATHEAVENMIGKSQQGLVFGSRMDVVSPDDGGGRMYSGGYDYFFFSKSLISIFDRTEFVIGAPWWDYWMPIAALIARTPIMQEVNLAALHLIHEMGYSRPLHLFFGRSLIASVADRVLRTTPQTPSPVGAVLERGFTALNKAKQAEQWELTEENAVNLAHFLTHAIVSCATSSPDDQDTEQTVQQGRRDIGEAVGNPPFL